MASHTWMEGDVAEEEVEKFGLVYICDTIRLDFINS